MVNLNLPSKRADSCPPVTRFLRQQQLHTYDRVWENTWNKVISLDNRNVITEIIHNTIPFHWFQDSQNLLTVRLNSKERLKAWWLLNEFLFFKTLATWSQKSDIPFPVLREADRPRSNFPSLAPKQINKKKIWDSQFYKGHEKGQKKSSGFPAFNRAAL